MEQIAVRQDVKAYFEEVVIPLIAREHPEVVSEMSLRVEGSVGEGLHDELSDLDATLFLPKEMWKARGGQLQLTLLHSLEPFIAHPYALYSECAGDPFSWPAFRHSEISVHPWSELLCGQAESVLAGEQEVPWEEVSIEELLQLQVHPILRDAHGVLARLREATAPERYPQQLWIKRLIHELVDLKGEPWDLEKTVRRGRPLEAQMILGAILPRLFRVAFLINKRYYPGRRRFFEFFKELPVGPRELLGEFEILGSHEDWHRKSAAVNRIVRILTEQILESGMLTADMFEFLCDAQSAKAWENPDWRAASDANQRKAREAGYDWLDGWIWGRWGWDEEEAEPSAPPDADRPRR
jgi:hypothetical protein